MLVVHSAAGDSLSEQLGALRSAVCIARALGAELVLPRWKCGPFWLSSKHVIDLAPVAALVPLVSESDAQAVHLPYRQSQHRPCTASNVHPHRQACIAAADTVHCVRLGGAATSGAAVNLGAYLVP